MCLDHLIKLDKRSQTLIKRGFGWRVFGKNYKGELLSTLQGNFKPMPINRWLDEKDFRNKEHNKKRYLYIMFRYPYPYGFHIFLTRKDAIAWANETCEYITLKVKFKNIVAQGYQDGRKVIVAKNIMILKG